MDPIPEELARTLTNFVIEQRARTGWEPSAGEQRALVGGLETALLDRDLLRPILSHLQTLPGPGDGRADRLTDPEVAAVLAGGLGALSTRSPERFGLVVTDPIALLTLRDAILEVLPPYWLAALRGRAGRPPRSADEIWAAAASPAAADRGLALAALGPTRGRRRWTVTAPDDRVANVEPTDRPAPAVTVEFTLTRHPLGWRLGVELLVPPPLAASRWAGRLVSAAGEEVGRIEETDGNLVFAVPTEDVLVGGEFDCEYRRGEGVHVRFRVPVSAE
ncbi:hypothetical protein [Fimbriiglobus ruber]|uniref:Uncharacterized protein n=1 Tax=Fimbriiglobus ruber TaxID=1908690 RepID=A0A225DV09_9BACT|nr:hypothetical protein [Fimbriiglobus ruber]OWK40989.1 hypothetical protein FRUB_04881 [Fimbriiglobus ruber]